MDKIRILEEKIVCPACRGSLQRTPEQWLCTQCRRAFPVHGQTPVMLDKEQLDEFYKKVRDNAAGQKMQREFSGTLLWGELARRALAPPPPYLKRDIANKIALVCSGKGPDTWVLNIGAGGAAKQDNIINLDAYAFPGVDVVADAHRLPFPDNSVDGVILIAVLEHVRRPQLVIQEIQRVVTPGGYVYIDVPFLAHYHGYPTDFQRFTLSGLEEICSGFEKIESGVVIGPSAALGEMLRIYVTFFTRNFYIQKFFQAIVGWLTVGLRYLDRWLVHHPDAYKAAYANFFLGRKR